jgi:hypothetical protein
MPARLFLTNDCLLQFRTRNRQKTDLTVPFFMEKGPLILPGMAARTLIQA